MRFDFILFAIGLLLAIAMALTLLYGSKHGRHGYGQLLPVRTGPGYKPGDISSPATAATTYGCPCRIG